MKKGVVLLFGVLFFAVFILGVVSAADSQIIDKFKEILEFDKNYDYVSNILSPEILFGILIFLVIFAIVDQIGLFNQTWIKITLSIVVAILSAGFIDMAWVQPLLNQYSALGITITLLFPFVLVFYFLRKVAPYSGLVHKIVWGVFLIITIINAFLNWSKVDGTFPQVIYAIIIIGCLVMLSYGKEIFKKMFKEEVQEAVDKYDEILQLIAANNKAEAKKALSGIGSQLSPAQKSRLQAEIAKLP
jgi:hypothetical protein